MGTSMNYNMEFAWCQHSVFCAGKMIDRRRAGAEKKAATRPPSVYWWMVLVIWTNGPRSSHLITKSHPTRSLPAAFASALPYCHSTLTTRPLLCALGAYTFTARRTLFYFANCGQTWRVSPIQTMLLCVSWLELHLQKYSTVQYLSKLNFSTI
jgi:hypothetical protein